jgi:hypothetical protein
VLSLAGRPDASDDGALGRVCALGDGDGAEMNESDGVAVACSDRQGAPAAGNGPGELHDPGCRGQHRRASCGTEIDAAMLAAGVRIGPVDKWFEHRPVHGPGPGECGRRAGLEREEDRKQQAQTHGCSSSLS